jgi:hypothetical protein
VVVEKKEDPILQTPTFEPIPETKKEAKELAKYKYLPGERLQIMLNKEAKKAKKKKLTSCKLREEDVDRISKSMGRVVMCLSEQQ